MYGIKMELKGENTKVCGNKTEIKGKYTKRVRNSVCAEIRCSLYLFHVSEFMLKQVSGAARRRGPRLYWQGGGVPRLYYKDSGSERI